MMKLNDMNLTRKIVGGYAVVLVSMVLVSTSVFVGTQSMIESSKWVLPTYEVIRVAESAGMALVDMETGQRGFLIAGSEEYLQPFNDGKNRFRQLVARGKQLTSDDPQQTKRWDRLLELEGTWLTEAAEPQIDARRVVGKGLEVTANYRAIASRTVGKDIFDSIREQLALLSQKLGNNRDGQHLVTVITLDLVNMETGQRGFLLTGKEESLQPFKSGSESLTLNLKKLTNIATGTRVTTDDITEVQKQVDQWIEAAANPEIEARREMNQYTMSIEDVALLVSSGNGKATMDSLRTVIQEIVDLEEANIVTRTAAQQSTSEFTIGVGAIGTLVAVLFGVSVAFIVARGVVGPINAASLLLKDIADGDADLTARLPVQSQDEVGALAESFNQFIENLQRLISQVIAASTKIQSSTQSLAAITEQTSAGVNDQRAETEQVAAAIEQMSTTVQEVAKNAEQASDAAASADQEAAAGNRVVSETILAINSLAEEVESSAGVIESVKEDSKNIGSVLDVIKGIAEQTNLLALNAAIEAARAGEQGRGFAVVADEVRTLAQRTQESTAEIEDLVGALQTSAEQAVDVMSQSRDLAKTTVAQARHAGESLAEITTAVATISAMNTQIASAAQQQGSVADEINRNISNISDISEQTAESANQAAISNTDLSQLGLELQALMSRFKVA